MMIHKYIVCCLQVKISSVSPQSSALSNICPHHLSLHHPSSHANAKTNSSLDSPRLAVN